MASFRKLMSNIDNPSFRSRSSFEIINSNLKSTFNDSSYLNILVYNYNILKNEFKLRSSNYGYKTLTYTALEDFIGAIKPCFRSYLTDYFAFFIQFLTGNINKRPNNEYSLQIFLPIKKGQNEYLFVALYILPEILNSKIVELYILLLPLKIYKSEIITINVLKKFKNDNYITNQIKNKIQLENVLTEEQIKIANLLHLGYSSKNIAVIMDKRHDNILKYNIRIKERLSHFFNDKFDSAKNAVDYYKSCFP